MFTYAPTVEKQLNPPAYPLQPMANSFLGAQARGREWQEKEALGLGASYPEGIIWNFRETAACHRRACI